ncbi:MAG: MaoC family dehydratase [Gammaproteobacteria bacterium]
MSFPVYYELAPGRYRERYGLCFEDFVVGQRFRHRPGVTLTQQDNADDTLDTYNGAQIHFDERYAAQASWRHPLMVSTLTVQRLLGMASKTLGARREILGFEQIAMSAPVFGGDTVYAESEVLATAASADPMVGVVTLALRGFKQRASVEGPGSDGLFATLVARVEILRAGHWPPPDDAVATRATAPRFSGYRLEDGVFIEQCGLFFEDAQVGESFVHAPRRSFHRFDVVSHSRRSFDHDPRYQDLAWLAAHTDGRLRVPEALLLGAVTALTTRTFGRVSANLGWTGIELAQAWENDTVEATSTIVDARTSKSRVDEGILTVDTVAHNQHGEQVCAYRRNLLVYKRAGDSPYAKAGY